MVVAVQEVLGQTSSFGNTLAWLNYLTGTS
jgi:hypothetical protein